MDGCRRNHDWSELLCISRSDTLITWDALNELIVIEGNVSRGKASYFWGGIWTSLGGPAEGKGCESEVFSLYVHRQNYFRDFCAAEGRRRILRIYSKLSIMLEKNDGTKNVPLVPVVSDGRYHVGLASLVSGLGFALSCSSYHRLADSSQAGIPFLQEWYQSQCEALPVFVCFTCMYHR